MRKAQDNSQALAAFVAHKSEIDAILTRLGALSAEHFGRAPDEVSWADVGTLGGYLEALRRVTDVAFHEGDTIRAQLALGQIQAVVKKPE